MERVMSELANFAIDEGHEVHIICLLNEEIQYLLNPSVKIYQPTFAYSQSLGFKYRALQYLISRIRRINPKTILSFGEIFNSLAIVACLITRKKVFVSDRSNPLWEASFLTEWLRRKIYPYANGFIAQTAFAKSVFEARRYNKNIISLPNPLKKIKNLGEGDKERKVIINVGRLVPEKNQKELIQIFKNLNRRDWKLYIIGDGPLKDDLQNQINKLELKENVVLVETTNDIDSWMERADIFAFTSISEGFPNSLSEAMAFPLACISYDCPAGPNEMIEDGVNGILVPMDNTNEYTRKLLGLIENKELRNKFKASLHNYKQQYSIQKIGKQYIEFIGA